MDASLTDQASALLGELDFLYAIASGGLLKYSFEWSGNRQEFKRNQVLFALAMGVGALMLAAVLALLMWDISITALTGSGPVHPVLVIFVVTWGVVIILGIVSLYAIGRAAADLLHFRQDLFGK